MRKILAVIPARGGSKGIPRKNIRFMQGKPLIAYAILSALSCDAVTDCVVTTDDAEIATTATHYGAEVLKRSEELSEDRVTLDPVVYDATVRMEERKGYTYDAIVTLQPTSPLLSVRTLSDALYRFQAEGWDTLISVVNKPHLSWRTNGERIVPDYVKRLNRQELPPFYTETGAFLITLRQYVTGKSRFGKKISVYEMPEIEATDIDTTEDWVVCESLLGRKRIVFRCDGTKLLGMGHIYNCLTMAFGMTGHEVLFVTKEDAKEGIQKIHSMHMPYRTITSDRDIEAIIREYCPDIWVNDCLNTTETYIRRLKSQVKRVVTIEDLGSGALYADATINALYEVGAMGKHIYEGEKYICLRDEFRMESPPPFHEKVRNILIMFGGTDPSNLTRKLYRAAERLHERYPQVVFLFVTGIGYDAEGNGIKDNSDRGICVYNNVAKVTDYMRMADVAVTSQGRTVFEMASMGIPAVVLAQNKRETEHTFATMKNGFLHLGLGKQVNTASIVNTLAWLIETPNIRMNMRDLMLRHDFKGGADRVRRIVLGENE